MLVLGIPMILSMVVQALYNIVDTMFVAMIPAGSSGIANYGSDVGVNALTQCFPVQMLMIAIGVGLGVGVNAMLSKALGEGNRNMASRIVGNSLFVIVIVMAVFCLFGLTLTKPFMRLMYGSSANLTGDALTLYNARVEAGAQYLTICCSLSFGVFGYMMYEKFLQGTGKSWQCMVGQISGAVLNIALDAVFILVCGWGVAGAAWATVIGQIVSFVVDLTFHYTMNKEVSNSLTYWKPDKKAMKGIFAVGIPAVLMQTLMSVMTIGANLILGRTLGQDAVTAFGSYYKVQQFIFFAAFGLNNAIIPIVSYNYGMQDKERVQQGIKWGIVDSVVVMALGLILFESLASVIANLFSFNETSLTYFTRCMRIIPAGFLFVGFNIAMQGILQALGCGIKSLILSCVRLLIPCLPLLYLLSLANDVVVWLALPLSEAVAFVLAVIFFFWAKRHKIAQISNQNPVT
jgi:putative MATE family efflux protein